MTEIERGALRARQGTTNEEMETTDRAVEARQAAREAEREAERVLAEIPTASSRSRATSTAAKGRVARRALEALRDDHPQTAARIMLGGRTGSALRSMQLPVETFDARLDDAGFTVAEKQELHEALTAEIGRRFHGMVRHDATRQVEELLTRLDWATRGDPEAVQSFQEQLFGTGGQELLARLDLLRAEAAPALRVLVERLPRRDTDREEARPLMLSALRELRTRVSAYREAIVHGEEGNSARWGEAYRAFENSVHRQAMALGIPADVDLSGPRMKAATVLERAVRAHITSTNAEHEASERAGRQAVDLAASLMGSNIGLLVRTTRAISERRMATLAAEERAISGTGSLTTARDTRTREIVDAARDIGLGAFNSVVETAVVQPVGERVRAATERAVRGVLESGVPLHAITPASVAGFVERLAEKALRRGIAAGRRELERQMFDQDH